jgi:hypothetical protein
MLNMSLDVTAAADARSGFGVGVFPLPGVGAVVPSSTGAVSGRSGAHWAMDVLVRPHCTAQHGVALGLQVATKQDASYYNAPKTHIAAARGGAPGAHPAREPV